MMISSITMKTHTIASPKPNLTQADAEEYCNSLILSVAIDLFGFPMKPTSSISAYSSSSSPKIV